ERAILGAQAHVAGEQRRHVGQAQISRFDALLLRCRLDDLAEEAVDVRANMECTRHLSSSPVRTLRRRAPRRVPGLGSHRAGSRSLLAGGRDGDARKQLSTLRNYPDFVSTAMRRGFRKSTNFPGSAFRKASRTTVRLDGREGWVSRKGHRDRRRRSSADPGAATRFHRPEPSSRCGAALQSAPNGRAPPIAPNALIPHHGAERRSPTKIRSKRKSRSYRPPQRGAALPDESVLNGRADSHRPEPQKKISHGGAVDTS